MRFRILIVAAFVLVCFASSDAQPATMVKVWKFSLPHGSLRIGIEANPAGVSSLSIAPDGQIPEAPIAEQLGPLRQVLHEMSGLGLDPGKIAYLGTRIFGQDVLERLAYACADSEAWRHSMINGGKGKEMLVVELLNQSGVYDQYNEVFKQFGVQMRVTEAEKVGLMPFSQIPPRNAHDRVNARSLVPADAMLGMRFSQVKTIGAKE